MRGRLKGKEERRGLRGKWKEKGGLKGKGNERGGLRGKKDGNVKGKCGCGEGYGERKGEERVKGE